MPGEAQRDPTTDDVGVGAADDAFGSGRLADVIRRLQEARNRPPRGSETPWATRTAEGGSPVLDRNDGAPETGELLWRPFQPEGLEPVRSPYSGPPPSRADFETHLSQFLGAHPKRAGSLFRTQGVTVRFGGVTAVAGVDLECNDGEIVAVVGPNGAGKTALCDALGGFTAAESGRIYIGERDISDLPAHERAALGLGRTFAHPALFESQTVAENLMTARHRRMKGGFFSCGFGSALSKHQDRCARDHACEVLELLGIEHLLDARVATLEPSARRLVEIGRAVAAEPRFLILDEPAVGLGAKERCELSERIGMICDELGIGVLITDQDLPFVASVADFVYVLDGGAVVGTGEPAEVEADDRVQACYLRPAVEIFPDTAPWPPEEGW
ncbi:MAG: ABC transporter ATP-binding protein [Acidimicrobiia bacterium]